MCSIQELQRARDNTSFASFLYSILGCIGTFLVAVFLQTAPSWAPLFHRWIRLGLAEYAAAISIVLFIGLPHIGELATLDQQRLSVPTSFTPTLPSRSHFFVRFWTLPGPWIAAAIVPGAVITTLFFFDVEVSTICATLRRYNTGKPGGFAWDVALLGVTTALCGILGIPPANGLLPQAPLHSESLLHDEVVEDKAAISGEKDDDKAGSGQKAIRTVYEQRWSHLLHAAGIFCFVSPPLMHVLGLTPTSVLAGLFLYMGEQSLATNPVLWRFFQILTPVTELSKLPDHIEGIASEIQGPESGDERPRQPLRLRLRCGAWCRRLRGYAGIHAYTVLQILVTAGIFAVTLTPAAPAFPVIIVALVPLRLKLMTRIWDRATLRCKSLRRRTERRKRG